MHFFILYFSCVVYGASFYFGLLLPICFVLVGNLIVLFLVSRGLKDGSKLVRGSKNSKNCKIVQVRIAFACSLLLGTTWIFAILAVGDLRDFFQWMFCIFNSLQGFFIFIFYTYRSTDAQKQWKIFFGLQSLERGASTWNNGRSKSSNNFSSSGTVTLIISVIKLTEQMFKSTFIQVKLTNTACMHTCKANTFKKRIC